MASFWRQLLDRWGRSRCQGTVPGKPKPANIVTDDNARRLLAGGALLSATLYWPDWVFRRVDSIHPLEGERGRRRHSIDCVPRTNPRLAYNGEERTYGSIQDVQGQVMVPLMYVEKGVLRNLDASSLNGPMPILGTIETTALGAAMIERMLLENGADVDQPLRDALCDIAGPSTSRTDLERVNDFLRTGEWGGTARCAPEFLRAAGVAELTRVLSHKFLLIGLIDARSSGTRLVLKLSYFWNSAFTDGRFWETMLFACGFKEPSVRVPMDAPVATRSYHMEFHATPDLACKQLELPQDSNGKIVVDSSGSPVSHVYGAFESEPAEDAALIVSVPFFGLRLTALLSAVFAGSVPLLVLAFSGAQGVWRAAGSDGPTTLLLAVPAVFLSFIAFRGESALVRRPMQLLRSSVLISALTMLLLAASLVGQLKDGWFEVLWVAVLCLNATVAGFLIVGRLVERRREKNRRPPSAALSANRDRLTGRRSHERQ